MTDVYLNWQASFCKALCASKLGVHSQVCLHAILFPGKQVLLQLGPDPYLSVAGQQA